MISLKRTIAGIDVTVETHDKPHLDEILALFLAENFATPEWVKEHASSGRIELGIGGGKFDEHPRDGKEGIKTECCATLMAKSLGLSDNPALTQILKWIYNVDVKGAGHPFDLYNLIKMMMELYPDDPERVIAWAYEGLRAKYMEQIEFVASQEVVRRALRVPVNPANKDTSLLVMVVKTDHKSVAKAAAEDLGTRYAAVVVGRSDGHVQVFTNKRAGIRLHEAVRLLRIEEFRQRGRNCDLTEQELRCEGFARGVPTWYYAANGELILNGSLTNSEVPATRVPLSVAASCVLLGIRRSLPKPKKSASAIQPLRI